MIYKQSFKLESCHRAVSFHDVTDKVKEIFAASGMKDGIVVVYSHHTTCSVITQECAFDMSMTGLETLCLTSEIEPEPYKVYLDRPFLYMIIERHTGIPLFMGTVEEI